MMRDSFQTFVWERGPTGGSENHGGGRAGAWVRCFAASTQILLAALVMTMATACASSSLNGRFDTTGYRHRTFDLAAGYLSETSQLLDGAWEIKNFAIGGDGLPTGKSGDTGKSITFKFDTDLDGRPDVSFKLPQYELLLEHGPTGARIALWLTPVVSRRLSVLLRDLIHSNSGSLYVWRGPRLENLGEVHFTSKILDENPASVDGVGAWAVTYELADTERIKIDPQAREVRGRLLAIEAPFRLPAGTRVNPKVNADGEDVSTVVTLEIPVLVMVGLFAHPSDFEARLPDFDRFVRSLRIGLQGAGQFVGVVPTPPGTAPPAGPTHRPTATTSPTPLP